jgi:peptidoglycan-N-acetylmuramic acid deacetylase
MIMYIKLFLLLLVSILSIQGCVKNSINYSLSDLGGAFVSDENKLDFSLEISGQLLEYGDTWLQNGIEVSGQTGKSGYDETKLLRWGLRRNKDSKPPFADPGAPELLKKYNGFYIGDTSEKTIYFTFDEGYENGYTPKILDALRNNSVKAVFFITAPYLKQHQDIVRRMIEEGHTVGNHTVNHPSLPGLSDEVIEEEVLGLDRAFSEKFGFNMKYLRPPKGEYSEKTLRITSNLGYRNVFWSFAYDDWYRDKIRGADYAYSKVMQNLHNGAVILLHAVSKDNADALDRIIKGAREKGYRIGRLEEID